MESTADVIVAVRTEIDQTLGSMRAQVGAFKRTATAEVVANYSRITAAIGRSEPAVTQRLGKPGIRELLEETDLLGWEVPHLIEGLFTEAWIQRCFTTNDS